MRASEYFNVWLEYQHNFVQRSTYEALTVYFCKHINPYFEQYELEEITPLLIQQYITYKLKDGRQDGKKGGLSLVSVRKHFSLLKQALNQAVIYGYISQNPCDPVRIRRKKSTVTKRVVMLTADEGQAVINAFEGHPLHTAVILSLYYGLRRSEVLGLKWSAIDFEKNTLTINHTIVKNLTIEAKDVTKSETSERTFSMTPEVRQLLQEQRTKASSEYVNAWSDGRIYRPDYLTRGFQRVLKSHGLPVMRFHDLRHSTASILFDRGWQLEDVKNWLGHADIETTSNIYLHYSKQRKVLLADNIGGMFDLAKRA